MPAEVRARLIFDRLQSDWPSRTTWLLLRHGCGFYLVSITANILFMTTRPANPLPSRFPPLAQFDMNRELRRCCIVGGNAVSAFLSWRLQATNACDVTLVWKANYQAVAQYGVSFK